MNLALLRVLYSPLDYIHQDYFRLPEFSLSTEVRTAINHTLIQRLDLATRVDFELRSSDFSQRLVDGWPLLRSVAWLLGCKIARASFAVKGRYLTLPEVARRFIALPVDCPSIVPTTTDVEALERLGAQYLVLLAERLPAALAQRLPLVFATGVVPLERVAINRSLLNFSFDYAKNTSR